MSATATQPQIDGLREANASLEHALTNCRRAARGERPVSRAAADATTGLDLSGLGGVFMDIFGGGPAGRPRN